MGEIWFGLRFFYVKCFEWDFVFIMLLIYVLIEFILIKGLFIFVYYVMLCVLYFGVVLMFWMFRFWCEVLMLWKFLWKCDEVDIDELCNFVCFVLMFFDCVVYFYLGLNILDLFVFYWFIVVNFVLRKNLKLYYFFVGYYGNGKEIVFVLCLELINDFWVKIFVCMGIYMKRWMWIWN